MKTYEPIMYLPALIVRSFGRKGRNKQPWKKSNTYKAVPPDYELTEEDKENMESDNFQLGYGSQEVEVRQYYATIWVKDGKVYDLGGFDLSISADEMLNMAKEIVESGN